MSNTPFVNWTVLTQNGIDVISLKEDDVEETSKQLGRETSKKLGRNAQRKMRSSVSSSTSSIIEVDDNAKQNDQLNPLCQEMAKSTNVEKWRLVYDITSSGNWSQKKKQKMFETVLFELGVQAPSDDEETNAF